MTQLIVKMLLASNMPLVLFFFFFWLVFPDLENLRTDLLLQFSFKKYIFVLYFQIFNRLNNILCKILVPGLFLKYS